MHDAGKLFGLGAETGAQEVEQLGKGKRSKFGMEKKEDEKVLDQILFGGSNRALRLTLPLSRNI